MRTILAVVNIYSLSNKCQSRRIAEGAAWQREYLACGILAMCATRGPFPTERIMHCTIFTRYFDINPATSKLVTTLRWG